MDGFDRFAICVGYHWYMVLWNAGGLTKRCAAKGRSISGQLHTVQFRQSPIATPESDFEDMPCALEVYLGLVEKYEGSEAATLEAVTYDKQV